MTSEERTAPKDPLFDAAERGDAAAVVRLLDEDPARLAARSEPYEWTLLHVAAHRGHLDLVNLLLARGLDVNSRERGDNTVPLHWAAAAGHVPVVKRLIEAGSDVIGHGDDHELEIIGWATCWEGCDDDAHREIVRLLLAAGARHHIFSAIAMDLEAEVRRLVAADPSSLTRRLSRNESHQAPLHFAVRMNRPRMVALMLELGADPLATDGDGMPPAAYAESADIDRPIMEAVHRMTLAELGSAERGVRPARMEMIDLLAAVTLREWPMAERMVADNPKLANGGVLHMATKRGDIEGVAWLLEHGADPNAQWAHWDAMVTPLHMAAMCGSAELTRRLLAAGADRFIKDSRHDGDALDWAEFFRQAEVADILRA